MTKFLLFTFFISTFLSQAQVSLVKDINPGSGDSSPSEFVTVNNTLIFKAGPDIEVWASDGTSSGTAQIIDLWITDSSNPRHLYVFDNRAFFVADYSSSLSFIVQTDGTNSGTSSYAFTQSIIDPSFTVMNNEMYFVGSGQELYKYNDISTAPIQLSTNLSSTKELSSINNNQLIFQSADPSGNSELWNSDGSASGTQLLSDIWPGTSIGSVPRFFVEYNGKVYFAALDPTNGNSMWETDGTETGTQLFQQLEILDKDRYAIFNGKLYFVADDGISGSELWVTDGTMSGTQLVFDLYPGNVGSEPNHLTVYNNALYFTGINPALGQEIYKCNIANSVTILKNILPGNGSSNPDNLVVYNNKLFFVADNGTNGRELWSSTGFSSTTNLFEDINTGNIGSSPDFLTVSNNTLYFSANDGITGIELWKYQDPSLSTEQFNDQELILFPNPTSDNFSIQTNNSVNSVAIYDIQGKFIKEFNKQLDNYYISDLNSGIYFIEIQTALGSVTKKIIKD